MARLIEAGNLVPCWFCGDDQLAIGALDALKEAGLAVPGDVGILGMNDMAMAGWTSISLSTIRQPFPLIIAASVDRLLARIETGQTRVHAFCSPYPSCAGSPQPA